VKHHDVVEELRDRVLALERTHPVHGLAAAPIAAALAEVWAGGGGAAGVTG
jgi:hypothetical protein